MVARIKEFFPYKNPRSGQLELARLVYESVVGSKILLARYPVGFGKTAAVLAGALASGVPRIVYLAHSKSQFQAPIRETSRLVSRGVDLTVITLTSKKDLCLFPRKLVAEMAYDRFARFCFLKRLSGECPYKDTVESLEVPQVLTVSLLRKLGREKQVCPYAIAWRALEKARIIVASYPYLFDPLLLNILAEKGRVNLSETLVIIDEAHNLPTFISDSLSSQLSESTIRSALREIQRFGRQGFLEIREALKGLLLLLDKKASEEGEEIPAEVFLEIAPPSTSLNSIAQAVEQKTGAVSAVWYVSEFINKVENLPSDAVLLALDEHGSKLFKIHFYNVSRIARKVFQSIRSAVLLSATLPPADYYTAVLGIEKDRLLEVSYPFAWGENVELTITRGISSRYVLRTGELYRRYARLIDTIFAEPESFHVLAVFPSYSFMMEVYPFLKARPRLVEKHDTTLEEILNFLLENRKCLVMIVAWGKFSEGVEFRALKKNLVDTIIIAGLPVPTPSPSNQRLLKTLKDVTGDWKWAWNQVFLYPALMKTLQIIGRGIRSETDRVRVYLLDERATEPEALRFFEVYGIVPRVFPKN